MRRDEAQPIVDDIRTLHELMTPADVIARKLHLPERLVRHVIQHGQIPPEQPQWKTSSGHIEA
ncbi:MAG: hypothetical protein RIK87_24725 [Fuerstiella sp.]